MSRISAQIDLAASRGEKAMGLFLTGGFPSPSDTVGLLRAMEAGGADFIELGMPFSDPLAEGLPIQRASERALGAGATMHTTLAAAAAFRAESDIPLLLMGYVNPVLRYGVDAFFAAASEAGVDGVILPDLPPEERSLIAPAADTHGVELVHLIAPNTPDDRIRRIDRLSRGFVYAVSITGLTGTGLGSLDAVASYLKRARSLVRENRLMVGFGIGSRADAERLSVSTDGFIVGSALIRRIEALWDDPAIDGQSRLQAVTAFVRSLRA